MRRHVIAAALLSLTSASVFAQTSRVAQFMDNCRRNRGDDERFCETRNVTLAPTQSLNVDGRANGGITVHGWDKSSIEIVAMIQAQAESEAEAQSIAKDILVTARNGEVRADGPDTRRHESWSVSYEVFAPRRTELVLTAQNGGISVDGVNSKMALETVNGGLSLTDVDGDVRGPLAGRARKELVEQARFHVGTVGRGRGSKRARRAQAVEHRGITGR